MFSEILYAVEDGIATITLNRPEKLNAFTNTMRLELIEAFDRVDADDDVRAVIVTGAGRAFCAGADLSAGGKTFDYAARGVIGPEEQRRDGGGTVSLRIFDCLKPVIAAVNGPAVGVGATMQLPMDIRLAADGAAAGARDRRQHLGGFGGARPADALAHARRRPSDGSAQDRFPRHPDDGPLAGRL
ncbi:MAG TPA: enoyl-CoA hydratase-related protein [Stellaceae bacterium]|nr:enoyl-CoA hydratase-related protein [Stellaceae bacterium]